MSAERFNTAFAAKAEIEASYGTEVTSFTVSGLRLLEAPIQRDRYLQDLRRGQSQHAIHEYTRLGQIGLYRELTLMHEMTGPVNAWSTTIIPSGHHLLRACGLTATLDATPGTESWTYAPITVPSSNPTSATIQTWWHGQTAKLLGCLGSFEFEAEGLNVPRWTFNFKGKVRANGAITDAAVDTTGFGSQGSTPLSAGSVANIGLYTVPRIRSFKFTQNHETEVRFVQAAEMANPAWNVWGFATNSMRAEIEIVLEASALVATDGIGSGVAGINPHAMLSTGSTLDFKYKTYTGGGYSPYRFEIPRLQVTEFEPDAAGSVVLWRIKGFAPMLVDSSSPYPWRIMFPAS